MNNKKQIAYGIKVGVIILLFSVIWYKVANNQNTDDIFAYVLETLNTGNHWHILTLVLLLMPINWYLESSKWQIVINRIERISRFKAFKAILAGVTVSVFTPNRIGEYAGRVLYVSHNNRIQAALSTLIGSIAQLVTTILFGAVSLYFYYIHFIANDENSWIQYYLLALLFILLGACILFFISTPTLIGLLKRMQWLRRFKKYVSFFNRYPISELVAILLLSIIRYSVYSVQLYLLYLAFGVELSLLEGFILIPISFFIMTVVPSIALAELGIREAVALSIIGMVSDNQIGILCANFVVWSINLVIPAVGGSLLILKSRIFKPKSR